MSERFLLAPNGVKVRVGQIWSEVDPRFRRTVEVIGLNLDTKKVEIRWIRRRWASIERFNDKRSGYTLFREVAP